MTLDEIEETVKKLKLNCSISFIRGQTHYLLQLQDFREIYNGYDKDGFMRTLMGRYKSYLEEERKKVEDAADLILGLVNKLSVGGDKATFTLWGSGCGRIDYGQFKSKEFVSTQRLSQILIPEEQL